MKNTVATDKQFNHVYYKYRKELINGEITDVQNREGFLFDENFNVTDVRYKDLPKSFIYGIYEKGVGYLDSRGVKGLTYIHSDSGRFIRKDVLLVSYSINNPNFDNYDCYVKGMESLSFLKGVNRNSDYDVFPIYEMLEEYQNEYAEKHPNSEAVSYDLHVFIFGFPEEYRDIYWLHGDERRMRYKYETELMELEDQNY